MNTIRHHSPMCGSSSFAQSALLCALLFSACGAEEAERDEGDTPDVETVEISSIASGLTLGVQCLVAPGDGLSCPSGFDGQRSDNDRVFTCQRPRFSSPSCPIGWSVQTRAGTDRCKVILCTFGDCSDKTPKCEPGASPVVDANGNTDRCRRVESTNPQGCFGDPLKGAGCPSEAERTELVDGKFRCVDEAEPSCALPGDAIAVRPGMDQCRLSGLAPSCSISVGTSIFHHYERDVNGLRDKCVAHGWPLPATVQ